MELDSLEDIYGINGLSNINSLNNDDESNRRK
jgi:hypothetical protein